VTISLVTADTLPQVWASLLPEIQEAMRGIAGRIGEAAYYEAVRDGRMVMWVSHEDQDVVAGGILSVTEYPGEKVLFIELLAGRDLDKWLAEVEPLLKQYRDQVGATTIEALCRPGLTRKLKGWAVKAALMEFR
jgi:hypothetical protein